MSEYWREVELKELATITMGQSPNSSCVNTIEHGLPFLQGCAEFGPRIPIAKFHCSPPLRVAKSGSILISVRAPVGTTNLADQDYCIGRGLGSVASKLDNDNIFLLHAIEHNVGFLHRRSQGSTFLAIGSKELSDLPVPALESAMQRRIAEILSTLDETIEQTEVLIAKYQQIKAGLMHDLFTRGVTLDGHLRPPQSQAPHIYKGSSLGWIPNEWRIDTIATIAESLVDGPFGSNLKTEHYVIERGVRVVRLQNVLAGQYNDSDRAFISRSHAEYLSRHRVNPGDILIAGLGEDKNAVGRACCYPDGLPAAINKADCFRLRCNPAWAINTYVMHFLNTASARSQVRRFEQGVTRRRINMGNLRRVAVALPDAAEQIQIVQMLAAASRQIETAEELKEKLALEKHGLMRDLLTGRVRVKIAETDKENY